MSFHRCLPACPGIVLRRNQDSFVASRQIRKTRQISFYQTGRKKAITSQAKLEWNKVLIRFESTVMKNSFPRFAAKHI
jgi:hypothetical protein